MNLINELKRAIVARTIANSRKDYAKVIHASDIYNFCLRRYALYKKYPIDIKSKCITVAQALTYAIGTKIQEIVIENSLSLIGIWECGLCYKLYYGYKPKRCESCMSKKFTYKELNLEYKSLVGHIDMIHREADESVIVEIKSIEPERFKNITMPSLQHECQLQVYLYLINRNKTRNKILRDLKITGKYGYVLYVCKTSLQEPFKLFTVKYKRSFAKQLDSYLKSIEDFSRTGEIPDRICKSKIDLMAKHCDLAHLCFDGGTNELL